MNEWVHIPENAYKTVLAFSEAKNVPPIAISGGF